MKYFLFACGSIIALAQSYLPPEQSSINQISSNLLQAQNFGSRPLTHDNEKRLFTRADRKRRVPETQSGDPGPSSKRQRNLAPPLSSSARGTTSRSPPPHSERSKTSGRNSPARSTNSASTDRTSSSWGKSSSGLSTVYNSDDVSSSSGTSSQKANPVSIFGTTKGPAEVTSVTGRTHTRISRIVIPAGQSRSYFVSHPKRASLFAEQIGPKASTQTFTIGRKTEVTAKSDVPNADAARLTNSMTKKYHNTDVGDSVHDIQAIKRRPEKGTQQMAQLEGSGEVELHAQNYGGDQTLRFPRRRPRPAGLQGQPGPPVLQVPPGPPGLHG